jgi:hypothetical protein
MAISGIVLSMIIIIISNASHGFRRTNDEVNLQLEAQTATNQLTNLIMEASQIDPSSNLLSSPLDKKYVVTYNASKNYAILFVKDKNSLFLIDTTGNADAVPYSEEIFKKQYLMAEFVEDFTISGYSTNKVTIDISFALGEDTYSVSKSIKLRNAK